MGSNPSPSATPAPPETAYPGFQATNMRIAAHRMGSDREIRARIMFSWHDRLLGNTMFVKE